MPRFQQPINREARRRIGEARSTGAQTLDLRNLGLTVLPPEVGQLTNLQTLILDDNQLTTLPPEVGQLTNLGKLYLGGNQLTTLPPEVGQLANLKELDLAGNPLAEPLPDLVAQGTQAVLGYLRSLHDAGAKYEAKLLLLGDGEAGKSSVVARLRGDGFDPDRSSTHGIELAQLRLPHPDRQAMITLHTWDSAVNRFTRRPTNCS